MISTNTSHHSHPSRTDRQLMKIRETSTGLVLERQPPDAREYVSSGAFTYVPASTPSIREVLEAKSMNELHALAAQSGFVHNTDGVAYAVNQGHRDHLIATLVANVEQGKIILA